MPSSSRRSYFAIRAFNVELASVKDGNVSQKLHGERFSETGSSMALRLRLQWWRAALNNIYDGSDVAALNITDPFLEDMARSSLNNPVVRELNVAVQESNLTRRFLERLLEAREANLDVPQLETMDETINYCESTFSSLLYLSLECTNVRESESDLVGYHAGIGQGIVMALRGAQIGWVQGDSSIPKEFLSLDQFPYQKLAGYQPEMNEEKNDQLRNAVQKMALLASSHLAWARENQNKVPRHARSCFLPVVPALHYLSKLEKAQYNILDASLSESNNLTVLLLLGRAWLAGIF